MKYHLLGAMVLVALVIGTPAFAADKRVKAPVVMKAPPAPVFYDWSGLYAGGHIGYLWGATRVEEDGVVTEAHAPTNGVIGGPLVGFNWQNGSLVLGLEGDIGFSNAHGTGATQISVETPNQYDIRWTSHVRGRVGVATNNNLLFYVAGGLSVADFRFTPGEMAPMTCGGTFFGGSIGGGVQYGVTSQIAVRLEALYDDFGSKTYVMSSTDSYRVHLTGTTLRGGLTVKLWNPR